jgi:hypothetical protein
VPRSEEQQGLGLAQAIQSIRDDLLTARAAAADKDIQLPVESLTVELHVTATRTADGHAGFRVPVIDVEFGGKRGSEHESMQKVTVTFGEPVDRNGNPVKVARGGEEKPR